jgi:hypothetical protein
MRCHRERNLRRLGNKTRRNVHGGCVCLSKNRWKPISLKLYEKRKNNKKIQQPVKVNPVKSEEREKEKNSDRTNEKIKISFPPSETVLVYQFRVFAKYWFSECFAGCLLARLPCSLYMYMEFCTYVCGRKTRGRKSEWVSGSEGGELIKKWK